MVIDWRAGARDIAAFLRMDGAEEKWSAVDAGASTTDRGSRRERPLKTSDIKPGSG
ncbi:hypothetical protein F8568_034725 [Actinomadura sp. LD22]|uniref:Uncharacterized protein n=1 Tax=Actinomadura physcomitrii TaxID=2650748 RepID=A0A6I4MPY1_9ACTN|nr:hypothetical protein [Actinomadura physcomitrii]MWA05431.1 hypothetical protein [Actinomadura physcomitrii]